MNDRNYTISARIDATEFATVCNDLRKRQVPFGSIADVISILMREYLDTRELDPLIPEQVILLLNGLGLSTKRIKAFGKGRRGLEGLNKVVEIAAKAIEEENSQYLPMNFEEEED